MTAVCLPELESPGPRQPPARVCFLIDELARAGTETQLLALIRCLDRTRVEPYLCLLRGTSEASRALEPTCCPVLRLGVRALRQPSSFRQAYRLARFLRQERIDILQTYFPDSSLFGVLAGWLAGVPARIRTRNNSGHCATRLMSWLGRLLNPLTTLTVTNCEAARRSLLLDEKPSPASVLVLENGVDEERFASIPALTGESPAAPCVGVVANLRPIKGLDLLVRAAGQLRDRHPRARFRIAGEGDLRPHLEQQIASEGLSGRFALPGAVSDVPGFLAGLDIAVLCSRAEGMPNAVLEYMAAGRAIVATRVGAVSEMIEDGVHGLLVPPGDADQLAAALDRLLADPLLAARLGSAARQRAHEVYSRAAMVRRFERLYLGLVARQRARKGQPCPAAV